jgi:radical SAM superfamily enzyme YgiQ (UPF0313 family)
MPRTPYGHERLSDNTKESVTIVGARADKYNDRSKCLGRKAGRPFQGQADITLINMNIFYLNVRGEIDFEIQPPLGLLYLVAVLEQNKYAVDFVDYQTFPIENPESDPFDIDNVINFLGEMPEVVGLSCMANLLPFTLLVAKRIKELFPQKIILLGGVGPFGVEELILDRFPGVDIIARGEAEKTLLDLMKVLPDRRQLSDIAGISYCDNGTIVRTPDQTRLKSLDALPLPAYHHLNIEYYDAFNIVTSRGCPYGCRFCSVAPIWDHQASYRSHDNIIDEIQFLYENYGVERILFQDEFFYSTEAKMLDFCDRLIKAEISISWKCFGRVNLVTEQAMRRMAEAGCVQLRFGIESGSDRVLKKILKGFQFKDALRVVTQAVQIFPSVETFFIWGFPFEEMDDFHQTAIQMARFREMGIDVLPSLLSLLPQTPIYHDVLEKKYPGKLSFVPELVPIYVITGHEILDTENTIPERYRKYYDIIEAHPDIFPGFFLFDYETNIRPKHQILQQMGLS